MSDDFVIDVRQIGEYPLKGAADPGDFVLMQTGGLGGPYVVTTAYGVAQALGGPDGQVGIGVPLPGDAVATGVLASNLITPLGCRQGWNWYVNSLGTTSTLEPGGGGIWCFDGVTLSFNWTPGGASGQPIVNFNTLFSLTASGEAYLPLNTMTVARDPVAALEVATKSYVDAADLNLANQILALAASSVRSFNGRVGAVVLSLADVTAAGGAPLSSPGFLGTPTAPTPNTNDNSGALATTAFVATAITNTLASNNLVRSFNGRGGDVVLNLSDVTGAGGAPLNSPALTGFPSAPTPLITSNDTSLATTAFVQEAMAMVQGSLQGELEVVVSPDPPLTSRQGKLWWDSSDTLHGGALYVWYIDGGFGSWVVANSQEGSQGPQGPPGSSIKGSFDTPLELQTAHPVGQVGDAYLVAGDMYVWDAATEAWLNVGSLVGPQGPMGPSGPPSFIVGTQPTPPVGFGSAWVKTPDYELRFYDGTDWEEIGYLRKSGGTVTGDVSFERDVRIDRDLTVDGDGSFKGNNRFDLTGGAYVDIKHYPTGLHVHAPLLIDNYDPIIRNADLHCEHDVFIDDNLTVRKNATVDGVMTLSGAREVENTAPHEGNSLVWDAGKWKPGVPGTKFAYGAGDSWIFPPEDDILLITSASNMLIPKISSVGIGKTYRFINVQDDAGEISISTEHTTPRDNCFIYTNAGWQNAGTDWWILKGMTELRFIATPTGWYVINEGGPVQVTLGGSLSGMLQVPGKAVPFFMNVRRYTANGTYVPPNGLKYAIVECIGGGGAGASLQASGATFTYVCGGGGSGGYSRSLLRRYQIGASQTVTIGVGGTAPTVSAGNGGDGTATTFGSLVRANGGFGAASWVSSPGGFGGQGANVGTGDIAFPGATGGDGSVFICNPSAPDANTTYLVGGCGGQMFGGGRINAPFYQGTGGGTPGLNGLANTGAGGNGAASRYTTSLYAGGAGASGICIVTEFLIEGP